MLDSIQYVPSSIVGAYTPKTKFLIPPSRNLNLCPLWKKIIIPAPSKKTHGRASLKQY